jgi:hypothetical protein
VVAVGPYGEFVGFPSRAWESSTDSLVVGAVRDLRDLFQARARFFFMSVREEVWELLRFVTSEDRPLHLMDLFGSTFGDLQDVLSRDSRPYFDSFLQMAIAHTALLKSDPVVWAYSQTHAMVGDFLDPKNGYKKFVTVRDWIKDYCNGPWKADEGALSSLQELERSLLRDDWRAPRWLQSYACNRSDSDTRASVALKMISDAETEKVLETLAEQFWMRIKCRLAHKAKLARIELAKQGAFGPTVVPSAISPKPGTSRRRLTPFEELAGPLMHEARANEPARFNEKTLMDICSKLDARQIKPLSCLEGQCRKKLADWNQKHPNRPVHTFAEGIKRPAAAKFVRRGIQRALYRAQKNWEITPKPCP